jgi:hypothetical protein
LEGYKVGSLESKRHNLVETFRQYCKAEPEAILLAGVKFNTGRSPELLTKAPALKSGENLVKAPLKRGL